MPENVYLIAELSANHGGSLDTALKTVRAASNSGADAIKLQTYRADTITLNSNKDYFQITEGTLWDGRTLYNLYEEAYTPWEWHKPIFEEAKKLGLDCFSSPFDFTAVDFLEQFNPPYYKIASFEINDIPLIEYTASKGRPMIISTGMGDELDIEKAVNACKMVGNNNITLLKCTSAYPAPLDVSNLKTIPKLADRFKTKVGLSDHTEGFIAPVVATALGATVIEKHFILDKSVGGPDASFSMTPEEFKFMAEQVRNASLSLGIASFDIPEKSVANKKFRRSLFVSANVKKGEKLTSENVKSVRPSLGLAPERYLEVLGKVATKDLEFGEPLKESDFE